MFYISSIYRIENLYPSWDKQDLFKLLNIIITPHNKCNHTSNDLCFKKNNNQFLTELYRLHSYNAHVNYDIP